jgi:hypothetical protein
MIVTVRDRVQQFVQAGKTESEVVAEHPTSDFDTQWGHGLVRGDEFVLEVYASLVEKSAFNGKVAINRVL